MVNSIILFIVAGIVVCGVYSKTDVYDAFIDGARDGLKTTAHVFPHMVAIMVGVGMLRASGAIEALSRLFTPVFTLLKIPVEVLPLAILKPFSGGASLGVLADIYKAHGVDSRIGFIASAIMGSSETIFYTIALYFGYVGIKNTRHTLLCAFLAMGAGIIGAVIAVNLLY